MWMINSNDFKIKAKQCVKIYGQMASIIEYEVLAWEKLFWFLKFLIPKLIVRTKEERDYFRGIKVIYGNAPDTEVVGNPWDVIDLLYTGIYRIEESQLIQVLKEIQNEIYHLEPEDRKPSFLIQTNTLFSNIPTFKMNLIKLNNFGITKWFFKTIIFFK